MYDRNEPPQLQLVGFCDFVGVDIAPVSKKTAVKIIINTCYLIKWITCKDEEQTIGELGDYDDENSGDHDELWSLEEFHGYLLLWKYSDRKSC